MKSGKRKADGARESARLLFLHLAAGAGILLCAALYYALDLHFAPCVFHLVTGYYCMTCGATRAVHELLRLRLVNSFLLNPVPILLALFLLTVLGFELAGVIRRRRIRFRWGLLALYIILGVTLAHCLLRNFGVLPPPEAFY